MSWDREPWSLPSPNRVGGVIFTPLIILSYIVDKPSGLPNLIPTHPRNQMENLETKTVLNDLNRLAAALRGINKAKATLRKWRKAAKAGRVTSDQVANAEAVIRESLAADLAQAMEAGFALGQGDEIEWAGRADKVAAHLVR